MHVDVKFCGMTRARDVAEAVRLGAAYVGVIFAGGPREVSPDHAAEILRVAPPTVGKAGVFASRPPREIADIARRAGLTVVQLHDGADPERIAEVRSQFDGEIWAVLHVQGATVPPGLPALFASADAVLLDSRVAGKLGGTGVALSWDAFAQPLRTARGGMGRLVLAGGLTPENVAEAIAALGPDVVDVSSGIEASPGVKDHTHMQSFMDAVQGARVSR